VGWQLQRSLAPLGVVAALGRGDCDLTDPGTLRRVVETLRPQLIVNAAAYTAVDKAEAEPARARAINGDAVAVLAEAARRQGALLVHYSTDYVFDGGKASPYTEADEPNPVNAYGASKLAGEQALQVSGARALILRVSWVFGSRGQNFVKTILRLASQRDVLKVVADQFGSPTPAAFIADATSLILAASHHGDDVSGVKLFHLAAANPVSWFDFARTIVHLAHALPGFDLRLTAEAIEPIVTAEYPTPARRPANSRLATDAVEAAFGLTMPDWQPYLWRMLQQLSSAQGQGIKH